MIPMTVAEIAGVLGARLDAVPDPEASVTGPPTVDSREVTPGGLFVATVGARVDGHDYARSAVADGAVAVLAHRPVGAPAILVDDVQAALGVLARHVLGHLSCTVIGLTGSVGKTTTEDLLASVLERHAPTVFIGESTQVRVAATLYTLRHACASTWFTGGVPSTQVAKWAGHSVKVLPKVYARTIDGQDAIVRRRVMDALGYRDGGQ